MRRGGPSFVALALVALALSGCELFVSIDRSKLGGDAGGPVADARVGPDAAPGPDATPTDGGSNMRQLHVVVGEAGSGAVITSSPPGITCTDYCAAFFPVDQMVTLTITSPGPNRFVGWEGDCSGTGTCVIKMDIDRGEAAVFSGNGALRFARRGGDADDDVAFAMTTDGGGGQIFGGWFTTSIDFDVPGKELGGGQFDGWLARTDVYSTVEWQRGFGGGGGERVLGTSVDPDGNVIIVGSTTSASIDFLNGFFLDNPDGNETGFIVKLDAATGQTLWGMQLTGPINRPTAVATDTTSRVIVTGVCGSQAPDLVFGSTGHSLPMSAQDNAFVLTLTRDGAFAWARAIENVGDEEGFGVTTTADDAVVAVGQFTGTVQVDGTHAITANGQSDAYIVKYDPAGLVQWTQTFGGDQSDWARAVAIGESGGVLVTGAFAGTAGFGAAKTMSRTSVGGSQDAWIARLAESDGAPQWIQTVGSALPEEGTGITSGPGDRVVAVGTFSGAITLERVQPNKGSLDVYVATYSPSGAIEWSRTIGGAGKDGGVPEGSGVPGGGAVVAVDRDPSTPILGSIFVAGSFEQTIDFGGGHTITSAGLTDAFYVSFTP